LSGITFTLLFESFVVGFEKLVRKSVKPESEEKDASEKLDYTNTVRSWQFISFAEILKQKNCEQFRVQALACLLE